MCVSQFELSSESVGAWNLNSAFCKNARASEANCEAARAQDFGAIADRYRPQIFRFLLSTSHDTDVAETLTQECLLRAHRNWSNFRGEANVSTWLIRIAINLQRDYWRSRRLQFWKGMRADSVGLDEIGNWIPSHESSPEAQMAAKEQVALVWRTVNRLRERQRTVFLLHFVEEMKLSEIADATGLREGTVKAHLSRALKTVRAALARAR